MAPSTLIVIPVLILAFPVSKKLVQGLTMEAVR